MSYNLNTGEYKNDGEIWPLTNRLNNHTEAKMNYNEELADLSGRFDSLKNTLATRKGALKSAVDRLAKEHGVDNSEDAKTAMDDLNVKIEEWKTELNTLVAEIDSALGQAESGEGDDFDED